MSHRSVIWDTCSTGNAVADVDEELGISAAGRTIVGPTFTAASTLSGSKRRTPRFSPFFVVAATAVPGEGACWLA